MGFWSKIDKKRLDLIEFTTKTKSRRIFFGISEFVITFLVFNAFTTALHEWAHLEVVRFFGGDGYIIKTYFGGAMVFTSTPDFPFNVVTAFAGGLGVFLGYLLLIFLDWLDDIEQAAALIPIAISQLTYGIVEGVFLYVVSFDEFANIAQIALASGLLVGFIISFYIVANHLWGAKKLIDFK